MPTTDPTEAFARFHLASRGPVRTNGPLLVTGTSRVLPVKDAAGGEWFVKQLATVGLWEREVRAYELWHHLPEVRAPRAVDAETRCLLLPRAPGRQTHARSRRVMQAGGELARKLHAVPVPRTWESRWRETVLADVERRTSRLRRHGVSVDTRLVVEHAEALVGLDVEEVGVHGDFQPHNWRWQRGRLHVFDFARSKRMPAVHDLGRLLYASCWHRPHGFAALLRGYGRPLTPDEERFLVSMLPWRAVVAMHLGIKWNRPEMVDHGRTVLEAVAAESHWSMTRGVARVL